MVYGNTIVGKFINLYSVSEEDAEFTLKVRQDMRLTRYLPQLNISLDAQKEWIRSQRRKEGDYFFVAKDHFDNYIGTVGIYDIKGSTGEGGRLTSIGNALQSVEIQYLIFRFDFEKLGLKEVTTIVYAENESALKLSEKFGVKFDMPVEEGGNFVCHGRITAQQFKGNAPYIESLIYRRR